MLFKVWFCVIVLFLWSFGAVWRCEMCGFLWWCGVVWCVAFCGGVALQSTKKTRRQPQAVEWLILVSQRLNESTGKLGLQSLSLGPCLFLQCPVQRNKPKAVLRWVDGWIGG